MIVARFLNQNSFLLLAVVVWVIAAAALLRRRSRRTWLLLGGVTLAVLAGFFMLRLAPAAEHQAAEVKAQIGAGKPVMIEFRSRN